MYPYRLETAWYGARVAAVVLALVAPLRLAAAPPVPEDAGNGARPKPERFRITTEQIEDRIVFALARSPSLAGSDVEVTVSEGLVTLRGEVTTETARRRALYMARRARGVTAVRDELRVVPAAQRPDLAVPAADEALAKQIADRLAGETFPDAEADAAWAYGWDVFTPTWKLGVEVDTGAVTMAGRVVDRHQLRRAVDTVRGIAGVRSVDVTGVEYDEPDVHGGPYPPAPPPAAP